MKSKSIWNDYYCKKNPQQHYPDENLVRLLQPLKRGAALDFGCGKGRHLALLHELGFAPIYASDISLNALTDSCQKNSFAQPLSLPSQFWAEKPFQFDLKARTLQIIVLWGVLHYNSPEVVEHILNEIQRLLRKGGVLLGTLRASSDTHLQHKSEVASKQWQYYDIEEAKNLLSRYFGKHWKLGYMERTPLGLLEQRISHWFFRAEYV